MGDTVWEWWERPLVTHPWRFMPWCLIKRYCMSAKILFQLNQGTRVPCNPFHAYTLTHTHTGLGCNSSHVRLQKTTWLLFGFLLNSERMFAKKYIMMLCFFNDIQFSVEKRCRFKFVHKSETTMMTQHMRLMDPFCLLLGESNPKATASNPIMLLSLGNPKVTLLTTILDR